MGVRAVSHRYLEQIADAHLLGQQAAEALRVGRHVQAAELSPGRVCDHVGPRVGALRKRTSSIKAAFGTDGVAGRKPGSPREPLACGAAANRGAGRRRAALPGLPVHLGGEAAPDGGRGARGASLEHDLSDWRAALWFVGPNGWLGGRPVDVLDVEPDAVADATRREAAERVF